MRTKALLLAGALGLAGIATSVAQSNVYSLNVVGYINLSLTNGYNLVANQLDLDGTGTANTIYTSIGTNVPNLTKAYAFIAASGTYASATYLSASGTWNSANIAAINAACNPGGGLFVQIPNSASYPQTVTLVGNVLQGALTTPIVAGYQISGSKVPQAGLMKTDLNYTPVNLDKVFQWLGQKGSQTYGSHTYVAGSGTWGGGEPNLAVGESVFLQAHAGSGWSRNFTVQ